MNPLTGKVSSMTEMLEIIKNTPEIMSQVTYWHTIPSREAKLADFPLLLHEGIRSALSLVRRSRLSLRFTQ